MVVGAQIEPQAFLGLSSNRKVVIFLEKTTAPYLFKWSPILYKSASRRAT